MFEKLNPHFQKYISLNICFFIILIAIRLFEYFTASALHVLPEGSFSDAFNGLFYDFFLCFFVSALLFIPYILLCMVDIKAGTIFYMIFTIFIIIGYLALVRYFVVQLFPLGKDLFAYTTDEIKQTVSASGQMNVFSFLPFIIFICVYIYLPVLFRYVYYNNLIIYPFYILTFLALIFVYDFIVPNQTEYKNDVKYYLTNNKVNYFIYDNCFKESNIQTEALSKEGSGIATTKNSDDNSEFKYLSDDYPWLRIDDTPDALGPFLNKATQAPNIVIIFVESLSRAFCGKDAYLGSFTPFLDSLANHGLFWKNFLSASGRTFGVTPSILGSLPYGNSGFLQLADKAPNHLSIVSMLKKNNYYCSFFYGGDPHFDMMDVFYKRQNIDFILHNSDFGPGYLKFPPRPGGAFTWGYADREVYRKATEIIKSKTNQPRLDIYMTLATHDPFMIPNAGLYDRKFKARLQELNLNNGEKTKEYLSEAQKYGCIMYMDDAIRYLINQYKKRADFNNTIFVITGDHRMAEIPLISKIDKFHVPLIIYSPLVKNPEIFESVSSHLDITPSLIAFLRKNYNLNFPPKISWLGTGIDINKSFRNNHTLAFMWAKNSIFNFIDKNYFLNEQQLFAVHKDMDIEPVNDNIAFNSIQYKFKEFLNLNKYVCYNNMLYPDDGNTSSITKIFEFKDDFENGSSVFQNRISKDKIFSGKNSVKCTNNKPSDIILNKYVLKESYKNIYFNVKFKMNINPYYKESLPQIKVSIANINDNIIATRTFNIKPVAEKTVNSDKWLIVDMKNFLKLTNNMDNNNNVTITLVNSFKNNIYYDDLIVKLLGEK